MKAVRSVFASIMMVASAYFGSLTLQCMQLCLVKISPKTWRWYIDMTMYMWISATVWLMEWIIGIRFRMFGDVINENDRAIFIMNHRTRLDWLYFYGILLRYGWSLCHEKIVLKHELKRIPGAGWAMQCASYMFLRRNLQQDKYYLSNMLDYFCSIGHKTKVLLFPEGTDLNALSLQKSNAYAEKVGLERYKYVLHPRTAGFIHLVLEAIRYSKANGENLDAIYDITVAYTGKKFATNELGFALGQSSSEGYFLIQRYSLNDVLGNTTASTSDEEQTDKLKEFIIRKWHEKENVLANYYEHGQSFNRPERYLSSFVFCQWLSVGFIICNVLLCVFLLISLPQFFLPIFFVLNFVFIYLDIFHYGVDDWAMKSALKERYRQERVDERTNGHKSRDNGYNTHRSEE